jgi:hypothetical protein
MRCTASAGVRAGKYQRMSSQLTGNKSTFSTQIPQQNPDPPV